VSHFCNWGQIVYVQGDYVHRRMPGPKREDMKNYKLNLGCLHPVARVRSDDVGFNPSTQRHYRRYYIVNYIYILFICIFYTHPKTGLL
jgi:hypothetical protein